LPFIWPKLPATEVALGFTVAAAPRLMDDFGISASIRRLRRRQAQATQILKDVIEDQERRDNKRDDSKPPCKQSDRSKLPKVFVNARFAQIALNGSRKAHDQRADILVKGNVLGRSAYATCLASHG
jgi:hypothetical protein